MSPPRDRPTRDPALPGDPSSAVSVVPVDLATVLEALRVSLAQAIRHPVLVGVPDGRQPGNSLAVLLLGVPVFERHRSLVDLRVQPVPA